MRRILVRCIATLFVVAAVLSVEAQETTDSYEQPPSRKAAKKAPPPSGAPPYMECSGEGPKWSVQFVSWGARYLGGVNQPDQDFPGGFFWIADEKAWLWQMSSGNGLSAKIRKAECTQPGGKQTLPYAGVVYLPNGDILGGCCRKLRAGEGPAAPQNPPAVNASRK